MSKVKQRVLKRDGSRTKKLILEAATKVFAEKSFDGARVDEIARLAGVNKNMLYHHIGNKDDLFLAVLEHMFEIIRGRQAQVNVGDLTADDGMRSLIGLTFDIWVDMPEIVSLLSSENFQEGRHIRKSDKITKMSNPLLNTIKGLLTRGAKQGIFKSGIDPIDLYISITSLTAHYLSHHYTFEAIFRTKLMTRKRLVQRREHVTEMILRFLAK